MKRREFLATSATVTSAAVLPSALAGCNDSAGPAGCDPGDHPIPANLPAYTSDGPLGPANMFAEGIASGDPTPSAVVIWTRADAGVAGDVSVYYEVALDPAFQRRVAAGTVITNASRDYTVKVDVQSGLRPATTYYYRFRSRDRESPIGRTRTAPEGATSHLRFGVVSCASLAHGYFHAYTEIANHGDLDAVIHLGDYIYEYGSGQYGNVRPYEPTHECTVLDDYRMRYRQYRHDTMLAAAHRQHPFICIWDDHEIADDSYATGAVNHDPTTEGPYDARAAAALQAYLEYMPIREEVPGSIYRKLSYGDLCDLILLDTRNEERSAQIQDLTTDSSARTMLGTVQESWLTTTAAASTSRWLLLTQQVMVVPFTLDSVGHVPFNKDAWDGYPAARQRFLDVIDDHGAGRTVILTGDIHSSWASDVSRDPFDPAVYDPVTQDGAIAVEFVCPAITSPGTSPDPITGEDTIGQLFLNASAHIRWGNFTRRGYFVLDVRRDKVQADYYHLDSVLDPVAATSGWVHSAAVFHGDPKVVTMDRPEPPRAACEPAP